MRDAKPEEYVELVKAIAGLAERRADRKKFQITKDALLDLTGMGPQYWPDPTMELLPLMSFYFSSEEVEIDPTYADEFSARAAPAARQSLSAEAALRTIAACVVARIEREQEFTVEGVAAETGVPRSHSRRILDELSHEAELVPIAGGTFGYRGEAIDYLKAIAEPLDPGDGELHSGLRRDPTGHLIAQEHKQQLIGEAVASSEPLSILRIDLDKFKPVNDTHGHEAGDLVLDAVYCAIARVVLGYGQAVRAGGDEVVVLLPNINEDQALATAERLRQAIELSSVDHDGKLLCVTASIGVATAPPTGVGDLEATADKRQYEAKKRHGNCVVGRGNEEGS